MPIKMGLLRRRKLLKVLGWCLLGAAIFYIVLMQFVIGKEKKGKNRDSEKVVQADSLVTFESRLLNQKGEDNYIKQTTKSGDFSEGMNQRIAGVRDTYAKNLTTGIKLSDNPGIKRPSVQDSDAERKQNPTTSYDLKEELTLSSGTQRNGNIVLDSQGTEPEISGIHETENTNPDTSETSLDMPDIQVNETNGTKEEVSPNSGSQDYIPKVLDSRGTEPQISGTRGTANDLGRRNESIQISADTRGLNAQLWYQICVGSFGNLCDHPLFPKAPMNETIVKRLALQRGEEEFVQRIYGYLHPPRTGLYNFVVSSDDSSEVWLSNDTLPSHAKKICYVGEHNESFQYSEPYEIYKFPSQRSEDIHLEGGKKYYIEIIHMQGTLDDHIEIGWSLPGSNDFYIIDDNVTSFANETRESPACTNRHHHHLKPSSTIHRPQHINHDRLKQALSECEYRPNYLATPGSLIEVPVWQFLTEHHVTMYTFPYITYDDVRDIRPTMLNNLPLEYSEAKRIVDLYMEQVERVYPGIYKVNNILNVAKKPDLPKGSRFFLELNVTLLNNDNNSTTTNSNMENNSSQKYEYSNNSTFDDNKNNKSSNAGNNSNKIDQYFIISEYIYQNGNTSSICYPSNFQWTRQVHVAVILPVHNQGSWVKHFLDNLQDIYVTTADKNFSLIIFDFESDDIDWQKELESRLLPPHILLQQPGAFSRSRALNGAVKAVKDPNAIILVLDLHLEIPWTILDDARKHCVQGRSFYTPIITRLRCESTPIRPVGYWEQQGYGIVALYKSDWDLNGGLNEQKYKEKWGGEDWDLVYNMIMRGGLEYERLKHFTLFHFQHSRRGMWTGDKDIASDPYSN